jgi:hypothetical protein
MGGLLSAIALKQSNACTKTGTTGTPRLTCSARAFSFALWQTFVAKKLELMSNRTTDPPVRID